MTVGLAGGKGERLRPLTADRPEADLRQAKPMVMLGDKPILQHHLEWLARNGATDAVLLRRVRSVRRQRGG